VNNPATEGLGKSVSGRAGTPSCRSSLWRRFRWWCRPVQAGLRAASNRANLRWSGT